LIAFDREKKTKKKGREREERMEQDDPVYVNVYGFKTEETSSRYQNLEDVVVSYKRTLLNKKKAILLVSPMVGSFTDDIKRSLSKLQDKHNDIMVVRFTNLFDDILCFNSEHFKEFVPAFTNFQGQAPFQKNMFVYTDYEIIGGVHISKLKIVGYQVVMVIRTFLVGKWIRLTPNTLQRHMYEEGEVVGVFRLFISFKELANYMDAKPLKNVVSEKGNIPQSVEAKVDINSMKIVGRLKDSDYTERLATFTGELGT